MTLVQGHRELGLENRSAHSLSSNSFESELGWREEVVRVQESEGEGEAVFMGLSSLRSETRNSRAPVVTLSASPAAGIGPDAGSVPSAVPFPSRKA